MTDKLTAEQSAQGLAQRAAEHHAGFFDLEKLKSYFILVDSLVHSIADIFGIAHSVVNENGTVSPRNIHDVAADINTAANNVTAAGIAPDASAGVARVAAAVAAHSDAIAGIAADVKNVSNIVTSQQGDIAKALETAEQIPNLVSDVAQIHSMLKGIAPAGAQNELPAADPAMSDANK